MPSFRQKSRKPKKRNKKMAAAAALAKAGPVSSLGSTVELSLLVGTQETAEQED